MYFALTYRTNKYGNITRTFDNADMLNECAAAVIRLGHIVQGWSIVGRVSSSATKGTQYLVQPDSQIMQEFAWIKRDAKRLAEVKAIEEWKLADHTNGTNSPRF